ncbi:uncharacterized protein B0J16DRAFT_351496 [Fusarium flagelliforme]|uniref:Uncharacterized protein n=1 Tax=Fusarium flagelliforme TaxID=2675880 RepID=A0A395MJY1_9HYPO|nr:uncharacterized protein B0J16DRAFT_351496 [Fusarium flagelliforme]KAH7169775.1 hypothetical protein B0J16DRAFT_351496 [Fusarium flagelliforme]RFN48262.1 hypothetical protein FIE12Z_7482 [Fusarium flagelliforme]
MADFTIYVVFHSRYRIFDRSGTLPFSIVFGLRRRSLKDTDPRPLRLSAANSILDVPYALSHNLLTLYEYNADSGEYREVDVRQLHAVSNKESHLTIPSPVGRTESWKNSLSVYRYYIDHDSELASFLTPGKKYSIQYKSGEDQVADTMFVDEQGESSLSSKKRKLLSRRYFGRARFRVVQSLLCPPKIKTSMQIKKGKEDSATELKVTVTTTGNESITVQTNGRQHFLMPWGPMLPEEDFPGGDCRPRIIDPKPSAPVPTIEVMDLVTKKTVLDAKSRGICGLHGKYDPRPKLDTLTTLRPSQPLIRHVNISTLLCRLPDGKYSLRMAPCGMWWCVGNTDDFAAAGEDRVPHHAYTSVIPPPMLQCEDAIEIQMANRAAK